MNELNDVTRNQAMRALVASSEAHEAGVQVVYGTLGGQPFPWLLDSAVDLVRNGMDFVHIIWDDPDVKGEHVLLLLDDDYDEIYRFETVDPFELSRPPAQPHDQPHDKVASPFGRRAHLRVVRPAS